LFFNYFINYIFSFTYNYFHVFIYLIFFVYEILGVLSTTFSCFVVDSRFFFNWLGRSECYQFFQKKIFCGLTPKRWRFYALIFIFKDVEYGIRNCRRHWGEDVGGPGGEEIQRAQNHSLGEAAIQRGHRALRKTADRIRCTRAVFNFYFTVRYRGSTVAIRVSYRWPLILSTPGIACQVRRDRWTCLVPRWEER